MPAGAELERQAAVRSLDLPARLGENGAVGPEPAHPRPVPGAAADAGEGRAVVPGDQRPDGFVLRAVAHSPVRDHARQNWRAGAVGRSYVSAQRLAAADPPGNQEGGATEADPDQLIPRPSFRTAIELGRKQPRRPEKWLPGIYSTYKGLKL